MPTIRLSLLVLIISLLSACVVVPADVKPDAPENYAQCGDITYRKELKMVDLNDRDTGFYYSVTGVILSPILVPASALVSGAYTLAHNMTLSDTDKQNLEKCLKDDLSNPVRNL